MDRLAIVAELERWRHRARESQLAHYRCAALLSNRGRWFGWASAAVAAIIGVLALLSARYDLPVWARITIGVTSLLAAAISTVNTVEKAAERATQHHAAGGAYGSEGRAIGVLVPSMSMLSDQDLVECVEKIKDRLDAIPSTAPTIPDHIWKNLKELTPK